MGILVFVMNLAIALALGATIGLERQWRHRLAGLRTNALVAGGSALYAALSLDLVSGAESARIAAQIVSGVGFLGAGVIMREGVTVRGLNTAATIWCSAAVGALAGYGSPVKATIAALAVLATNIFLRQVAQKINLRPTGDAGEPCFAYRLRVVCVEAEEPHVRVLVLQSVSNTKLSLRSIHSEDLPHGPSGSGGAPKVEVTADIESSEKNHAAVEQAVSHLSLAKGVSAAAWSFETPTYLPSQAAAPIFGRE
jgi:putative Mg2+ transporter-C (MgtC) family protein